MTAIRFGTSGHRGIMGQSFTADHVASIAKAIAQFLMTHNPHPKVVIGYDCRAGNSASRVAGSYTQVLVDTLLDQGIDVHFITSVAPTPLVSWVISEVQMDGGIVLTASHNTPNYNGIKFNPSHGGPASSEVTQEIETLSNTILQKNDRTPAQLGGELSLISPHATFVRHLLQTVEILAGKTDLSKLAVVIDVRHGAGGDIAAQLLTQSGLSGIVLNEEPRADFGGLESNPLAPGALDLLVAQLQKTPAAFGVALDPDADRHAVVTPKGVLLQPEQVCAILAEHTLSKTDALVGLVTTLASSGLIRALAKSYGIQFSETPVGFKYFTPYFLKAAAQKKWVMGVESSGGLSISCHTMEKCGFLPIVWLAAVIANTGKSVDTLLDDIHQKYGRFYFQESMIRLSPEQKKALQKRMADPSLDQLSAYFGQPIEHISKSDGLKITLTDGSWILIRLSGTEPVARVYSESHTEGLAKALNQKGHQLISKP